MEVVTFKTQNIPETFIEKITEGLKICLPTTEQRSKRFEIMKMRINLCYGY